MISVYVSFFLQITTFIWMFLLLLSLSFAKRVFYTHMIASVLNRSRLRGCCTGSEILLLGVNVHVKSTRKCMDLNITTLVSHPKRSTRSFGPVRILRWFYVQGPFRHRNTLIQKYIHKKM